MSPALERGLDAPQWVDAEIASFSFPYFLMSDIALRPQQGTSHPFHYFSGCPHFTTPVVLTNWYKHQSQLEPLETCSLPAPVTSPALLHLHLLNIGSDFLPLCLVKFPLLKLPLLSSDAPNGASSECSDPTPSCPCPSVCQGQGLQSCSLLLKGQRCSFMEIRAALVAWG